MSKKVCIVGGAGFIGHNIAKKLSSHDYEVLIIDSLAVNNYNSLSSDNIPNPNLSKFILDKRMEMIKEDKKINILYHDARDYHLLSNLFQISSPMY